MTWFAKFTWRGRGIDGAENNQIELLTLVKAATNSTELRACTEIPSARAAARAYNTLPSRSGEAPGKGACLPQ
jgi:hypothetical protein